MAETVNQGNQSTANQPERTFTQTELNAIIEDRLGRERAKYTDYESLKEKAQKFDVAEEANKTELQKATDKANALQAQLDKINSDNQIRGIREKVAKDNDLPVDLLTGNDEETCKAQAKAIKEYAKKSNGYPNVKDKGEGGHAGAATAKQQFIDWFQNQ